MDPNVLKWHHREPLLKQELAKFKADIICMQEVDRTDFFFKLFDEWEYGYVYEKKHESHEGVLVGVSKSKFEIVRSAIIPYKMD